MIAAYAARGASGFGAAAAMPLLGLVIPLKILVPSWTLIGIVAGIALLGADRRRISWPDIVRLIPGTLIGIAIGLYVFKHVSSETLARALGVLVLIYGLHSLWATFRKASPPQLPPRVAALLGGFGGGITGTVVGTMGSMFYAMYFDAVRLAKDNCRASMTAILLTLTVIRGIGYFAIDSSTARSDHGCNLAAINVDRNFHRQPLPSRHERVDVPAHRLGRPDRERTGLAGKIGGAGSFFAPQYRLKSLERLYLLRFWNRMRWHAFCIAA